MEESWAGVDEVCVPWSGFGLSWVCFLELGEALDGVGWALDGFCNWLDELPGPWMGFGRTWLSFLDVGRALDGLG